MHPQTLKIQGNKSNRESIQDYVLHFKMIFLSNMQNY